MKLDGILREADLLTYRGLSSLFRRGLLARDDQRSRSLVTDLDVRLGIEKFASRAPGVLADAAAYLDGLNEGDRFERTCDLIALASSNGATSSWIGREDAKKLVAQIASDKVARFSFEPTIHPCLVHARYVATSNHSAAQMPDYPVRYAGTGDDVRLVAFAARFLGLDVYVDTGPPWEPSTPLENDEPSTDDPDIEISFPPNERLLKDIEHLKESIVAMSVPQALARGRVDVESVMLRYLDRQPASARIVVSEKALAGRKRASRTVRSELIEARRIMHITELPAALVSSQPEGRFILDFDADQQPRASFVVRRSNTVPPSFDWAPDVREVRGKCQQVTFEDVYTANESLAPIRYLAAGPLRGGSIAETFARMRDPERVRLSDVFDVIRPKTTRDDRWGEERVSEVTPSDLSEHGEILNTSRRISVRKGVYARLHEQMLKTNDIVFTLKGPVGRIGYVMRNERNDEGDDQWASQSLVIIRARRWTVAEAGRPSCDPRFLFMYLLTPSMRNHWRTVATNSRSRTIPIEEVERLALPENLYDNGTSRNTTDQEADGDVRAALLAEFEARRDKLSDKRELEQQLEDGLARVWKLTGGG